MKSNAAMVLSRPLLDIKWFGCSDHELIIVPYTCCPACCTPPPQEFREIQVLIVYKWQIFETLPRDGDSLQCQATCQMPQSLVSLSWSWSSVIAVRLICLYDKRDDLGELQCSARSFHFSFRQPIKCCDRDTRRRWWPICLIVISLCTLNILHESTQRVI